MKWTTQGLQQSKLVEMGLDTKDVTMLRYVIDFFNTSKMFTKIISNKIFFWIYYQTIIDDLPILKINGRRPIARRFNKYVKAGLMEDNMLQGIDIYMHKGKEYKRNGTFTYYHINPDNLDILLGGVLESTEGSTQEYKGVDSKVQRGSTQEYKGGGLESTIKDSSIIDTSIIDSSTIGEMSFNKDYLYSLNYGNTAYYFYPEGIYCCDAKNKITRTPKDLDKLLPNDHPVSKKITEIYGDIWAC